MRIALSLLLLGTSILVFSQNNLQEYTPSILFKKGDWEFKTFQNLYTQSKSFDADGGKSSTGNTENFFTSINQLLYGVNDQINVGFDVWAKHSNTETPGLSSQTAITGIGPKVKIAPFKKLPRLSLQSTLLFNLADTPEGDADSYFLETDATLWLNQVFFDLPLNEKSQLFFQQAFWYRFVNNGSFAANNFLQTQTSVFYSYFPNSRWTVYGMTEYFPTHYNPDDAVESAELSFSYFVQSGVGLKYQLIPNLIELEALYTNFWIGSEGQGAGETINLGIRVIRQK
ncbi:MAG: hypothetical protein HRT61_19360 [Ekhidna sp.]|nr:hypothetical protein [Ekhidna sp.]